MPRIAGVVALLAIAWGAIHITMRARGLEDELQRRALVTELLDDCIEHMRDAVSHGEIPREGFASSAEQRARLKNRLSAEGLLLREDRVLEGGRTLVLGLIDGSRAEVEMHEDVRGLRLIRASAKIDGGSDCELRALLDGVR